MDLFRFPANIWHERSPQKKKAPRSPPRGILRGGAINMGGFLIRSGGRIPFILLAGISFGAEAVGRFAAIPVVIQIAAALSSFGMRRSLFEVLKTSAAPLHQSLAILEC